MSSNITSEDNNCIYPGAELTKFQTTILRTLYAEDANGQDIRHKLETYYSESINGGRLYQNLDQLVDGGFITKRPTVENPRSNTYSLTNHGRDALQRDIAWLEAPLAGERGGR